MAQRSRQSFLQPRSPCLHDCGFRDGCCKNCFRTSEEVKQWNSLGPAEKQRVLDLAAQRRQVAQD